MLRLRSPRRRDVVVSLSQEGDAAAGDRAVWRQFLQDVHGLQGCMAVRWLWSLLRNGNVYRTESASPGMWESLRRRRRKFFFSNPSLCPEDSIKINICLLRSLRTILLLSKKCIFWRCWQVSGLDSIPPVWNLKWGSVLSSTLRSQNFTGSCGKRPHHSP